MPPGSRPLSAVPPDVVARIRPPGPPEHSVSLEVAPASSPAASSSSDAVPAVLPPQAAPKPRRKRRCPTPDHGAESEVPREQPIGRGGDGMEEAGSGRMENSEVLEAGRQPSGEAQEERGRRRARIVEAVEAAKRQRTVPPEREPQRTHRPADQPVLRGQTTLRTWLKPRRHDDGDPERVAEEPAPKRLRHGRAAAGPPT